MTSLSANDRPSIDIDGVAVAFAHRDIRYATDREHEILRRLVESEKQAESGRIVKEIVLESDYLDGDLVRFRSIVTVPAESDS